MGHALVSRLMPVAAGARVSPAELSGVNFSQHGEFTDISCLGEGKAGSAQQRAPSMRFGRRRAYLLKTA
jgi:hypothetical protein